MNVLLDTSVLIDLIARRAPYEDLAERLITMAYFGDAKLYVTTQSVLDCVFIAQREQSLSRVKQAVGEFLAYSRILSITSADIEKALLAHWDDFEDCVINACAERMAIDFLITRNTRDFAPSAITVVSPKEFLDWIEETFDLTYALIDW